MGTFKGLQVGLARCYQLLFVLVPIALEIAQMLLLRLQQLIHLDIILRQDRTPPLIVLLIAKLLNLRLGFLSIYDHREG